MSMAKLSFADFADVDTTYGIKMGLKIDSDILPLPLALVSDATNCSADYKRAPSHPRRREKG